MIDCVFIRSYFVRFVQGIDEHLDDPSVLERIDEYKESALDNLERLHERAESAT